MKIRLHGTEDECLELAGRLPAITDVLSVSEPYPDRGASRLVRVYVNAGLGGVPSTTLAKPEKRCTQCGVMKALADFNKDSRRADGLRSNCRGCQAAIRREHYATNRDSERESSSAYYDANRDAVAAFHRTWYEGNQEGQRVYSREFREAAKAAVLAHYGTECACCGSTERLSIDHVNGDGGAHRAEIGTSSASLYQWLIANGFPSGFQTLCLPCNQSKAGGERCRLDHVETRPYPANGPHVTVTTKPGPQRPDERASALAQKMTGGRRRRALPPGGDL